MKRRAVFCVVVVAAVVACCAVGCDLRPTLAQLRLFAGYRTDLVDQCCQCLSRRGTGAARWVRRRE